MNKKALISGGILVVIALILLSSTLFIVSETDQVIITQFGKPVGAPIINAGVHVKLPLLQETHFFDKRFLEWDGDPNQVPTRDKRFIWVDTYARWRIADPLLFFQRVKDERGAHGRLDDILDGETRNALAGHDLIEIVRTSNRVPQIESDTIQGEPVEVFSPIAIGREKITREILKNAAERTWELGIELLDIRLKRINYVEEVRRKVYERMIAERKRIADKYRSEGQGEAAKIMGDKERELKRIQSEAYRSAQEIMGKADAQAAAIYASAYNQSPDAKELYGFLKTLETYKATFSERDWIILSTKNDFYRYLEKMK
ncbi:MAG: protease modulator HflC [Candidatus Delongbacteria bacterium]|nr:protease modulator HflC [Candidatus Delongbacteria bacterium]